MKNISTKKGFTLIELLIVITIIGILAVALLPSVLGAPARARDAARKADLNNIVGALETYNSDHQQYPQSATCIDADTIPNLPGYLQGGKVPKDPQQNSYKYCSVSDSSTISYFLISKVENPGDGNAYYASLPNSGAAEDVGATVIDQCKPKLGTASNECNYYVVVK